MSTARMLLTLETPSNTPHQLLTRCRAVRMKGVVNWVARISRTMIASPLSLFVWLKLKEIARALVSRSGTHCNAS